MNESDTPANVGSMEGLGLEPAAHVRWHAQNGFDVTEFSGLRKHPEVEAFWGNRTKLALYTADQVRAAVTAERERQKVFRNKLVAAMQADYERLRGRYEKETGRMLPREE